MYVKIVLGLKYEYNLIFSPAIDEKITGSKLTNVLETFH